MSRITKLFIILILLWFVFPFIFSIMYRECERWKRKNSMQRINDIIASASDASSAEKAVQLLLKELEGNHSFTRCSAANGIGRIGAKVDLGASHDTAVRTLAKLLDKDTDGFVVRESALALMEIGRGLEPAIPALIRAVQRPEDIDAAWFSAEALGKSGKDGIVAIPVLEEATQSSDDMLAEIARESLEKLRQAQREAD